MVYFNKGSREIGLKQKRITSEASAVERQQIPLDPQIFYSDFGLLMHPKTKLPATRLTTYQYEIWRHPAKYKMVIKSQKVGLSTSELLHDFQLALTTSKGQDVLIIAQTLQHATEHLNTLKFMIANSTKYSHYLINNSSDMLFKEMKTKLGVAYIKNPDNPLKPTRIIALGSTEGAVWSWKNVSHIHMSDIAAASHLDDSGLFAAAFSRLANTNGSILIETPPRGPQGTIYNIYTKSKQRTDLDNPESQFKIFHVYAREAVQAGLISQEFLDSEKQRLGPLYPQYYEAEFLASINTVFDLQAIEYTEKLGLEMGIDYNAEQFSTTSLGIDPAWGSSKFALVVVQRWNDKARLLYAQTFERPNFDQMLDVTYRLMNKYRIDKAYVDASSSGFISSLKIKVGETTDYMSLMHQAKKENVKISSYMQVVPVVFSKENKMSMLQNTKQIIEFKDLAVHPSFKSLLDDMRTAVEINGILDKGGAQQFDLLEALMLSLEMFHYEPEQTI
jgi:hypothetical protein